MTKQEENYFVQYTEEGIVESESFQTLPLARKAGMAFRNSGTFISLTNKKGVKLPL